MRIWQKEEQNFCAGEEVYDEAIYLVMKPESTVLLSEPNNSEINFNIPVAQEIEASVERIRAYYRARTKKFITERRVRSEDTQSELLKDMAIHELIANARGHGGGLIRIDANWKGWKFMLSVKDSGIGPSAESIESGGTVIIEDFATQIVRRKLEKDGYKITIVRSLPAVLRREQMRK